VLIVRVCAHTLAGALKRKGEMEKNAERSHVALKVRTLDTMLSVAESNGKKGDGVRSWVGRCNKCKEVTRGQNAEEGTGDTCQGREENSHKLADSGQGMAPHGDGLLRITSSDNRHCPNTTEETIKEVKEKDVRQQGGITGQPSCQKQKRDK